MSDLGIHLGSDLGGQNRSNIGRNLSSNQASRFIIIFIPLEASLAAFGVHFEVILGCFLGAPGGKQEFVKNSTAPRRELDF